MMKKTIINANTSLLRFLFIAAMVLISKFAFAGSDLYGKWVGSTDKNLELYVVDDSSEKYNPYPSSEQIPCFGYLVIGQFEDGQDNGYLIAGLVDNDDYLEITLQSVINEQEPKIPLRLNYKNNQLTISVIEETDNAALKGLDGTVMDHELTLEQLRNEEGSDFKLTAENEQAETIEEGDPDGPVYDGSDSIFAETGVQSDGSNSHGGSDWKETLMMIVFGILYVAMIGHMVFELFIRRRPYKVEGYTQADMIAARKEAGLPENSTNADDMRIISCLEKMTDGWTYEQDQFLPISKENMDDAERYLMEAINLKPTDEDAINRINESIEVLEANWKRQFNGSIKLIVLTLVVSGLMAYFAGSISVMPFFIVSLGIYYMASLTPTFMLNKIAIKGKDNKSFFGGLIAGVFAFIGSAQTVTTITKYTDGSKDVDKDHTQHLVFLAIGLIILMFVAIFVSIWAIFSYIRNYLIFK